MDERALEELWDAARICLEEERAEDALALALSALAQDAEVAEAFYLAGLARLELDQPVEAREALESACRLAPDWTEAFVALAWACFRLCEFERAEDVVTEILADADAPADAQQLAGLLAERRGDDRAAARAMGRAHDLDPEGFPLPVRMSTDEFERCVEHSLELIPEQFRRSLENLAIVIEQIPASEILTAPTPPHDPQILGLFVGTPLPHEHSAAPPDELPRMSYLFQRNIERAASDAEDLEREIAITLYHELGHALGFEEWQMPGLGLE